MLIMIIIIIIIKLLLLLLLSLLWGPALRQDGGVEFLGPCRYCGGIAPSCAAHGFAKSERGGMLNVPRVECRPAQLGGGGGGYCRLRCC